MIEETLLYVSFLILVDDGSTDGTGEILKELSGNNPRIHLIAFPKNRGKGAALLEGMRWAVENVSFDVLVTLDSDGQHAPSEVRKVAKGIEKGAEISIGGRDFERMPFRSRVSNKIISFLFHILDRSAPHDTQSGFRAFSKPFVRKIIEEISGAHYEMESRCIFLALKDCDPIAQCTIETIYLDKNRSSHFSKITDSYRILKALFQFWRSKSL